MFLFRSFIVTRSVRSGGFEIWGCMGLRIAFLRCSAAILSVIVIGSPPRAIAADPTTQPDPLPIHSSAASPPDVPIASRPRSSAGSAPLTNPGTQRDDIIADLQSGDDARVASALAGIQAYITRHGGVRAEVPTLQILIDAKRYSDLNTIALAQIMKAADYTPGVAAMEKLRAQAFLAGGDSASALSTAKAYYNVCALKDTADAIDVVSLALAAAHPEDSAIVERFKDQQVAWATAAPASQPAAEATDKNSPDAALGTPILAGIPLDGKPFDSAIAGITFSQYKQYVAKGNLLLISGRAAEAHEIFKKASVIAPSAKAGEACENVARAIRAESGCVAPANAYVLSMQPSAGDAK